MRGKNVILDEDLAEIYGVETRRLNEQVSRNIDKFPKDFMFRLNKREFTRLMSQNATSRSAWGGRRKPPYAFTEFGVLQVANVLRSDLANAVSIFVIRAFVQMRELMTNGQGHSHNTKKKQLPQAPINKRMGEFFREIGPKLENAMNQVLDAVIDTKKGTTVREEARDILNESINHLKARLQKTGLENEEIAARITKILAEAEKERANARKTQLETDHLELMITIRRLRLVLEAQKLLIGNVEDAPEIARINSFIGVLKELT